MTTKETLPEEVYPSLLRLLKIYWSQLWRISLFIILLGLLIIPFLSPFVMQSPGYNVAMEIHKLRPYQLLVFFPFTYLWFCAAFRLIIGLYYSDFTLSFVPRLNKLTRGFWPSIFYVSWAYSWRITIAYGILELLYYIFPFFLTTFSIGPYFLVSFFGFFFRLTLNGFMLLNLIIHLFVLRVVLNKRYGRVRLSLVKVEAQD